MNTCPASAGALATELLADLAAASRILAAQGVVDGFGHVSMRHPADPQRYVMARALAPARVLPTDLIEYDLDSTAVNAQGRKSFLERFIHGEVYKARPDVMAVVHSHSPSVVPFGLVRAKMQAMTPRSWPPACRCLTSAKSLAPPTCWWATVPKARRWPKQ